ncbi:MAG TPA: MFS transporter [bacterium]|nr:MFS transporter [bacterium]
MEKRPGLTMAVCGAVQGIGGGFAWSVVPVLMPAMAKDLHLSQTMGGLVWGAAPLGIALSAPVGGALVDRFGVRRTVPVALLFGALACAARAFAHDPFVLLAAMFAFGLHIGLCAPAIPKALAAHVPIQKLGRANGLTLLCYTLATALTVLFGATVIAPALGGWRPVMLVAAAALVLLALLWGAAIREGAQPARHASAAESLRLLRDPQLRRLAAMQFFLFGGYLAMLGILPRALLEAGLPVARVGETIAAWLGVAAVANFAGPALSDRIRARRPLLLGGAAVAGLALLGMSLLPISSGVAMLMVAALGGGSFAPLLLSLPLELPSVGPARAGAALGLLMLVGQIGGFLLPVATGAAAQHGGLALACAVLALAHLAILLPANALQEPSRGDSTLPESAPAVA